MSKSNLEQGERVGDVVAWPALRRDADLVGADRGLLLPRLLHPVVPIHLRRRLCLLLLLLLLLLASVEQPQARRRENLPPNLARSRWCCCGCGCGRCWTWWWFSPTRRGAVVVVAVLRGGEGGRARPRRGGVDRVWLPGRPVGPTGTPARLGSARRGSPGPARSDRAVGMVGWPAVRSVGFAWVGLVPLVRWVGLGGDSACGLRACSLRLASWTGTGLVVGWELGHPRRREGPIAAVGS